MSPSAIAAAPGNGTLEAGGAERRVRRGGPSVLNGPCHAGGALAAHDALLFLRLCRPQPAPAG